jgi:HEPN domain-containing protein
MDKQDFINEWLSLGNDDLRVAEHSFSLYPIPREMICYHCEQAAEKYLKAYLLFCGIEPPRTHDLQTLCRLCEKKDGSFSELRSDCSDLTKYAVHIRYPFEIEIEDSDAHKAITETKHVIGAVSGLIGHLPPSERTPREKLE